MRQGDPLLPLPINPCFTNDKTGKGVILRSPVEQGGSTFLVGVLLTGGPHVTGPCLVTPVAQLGPPMGGVASQPALECLKVQQPIDGGVG